MRLYKYHSKKKEFQGGSLGGSSPIEVGGLVLYGGRNEEESTVLTKRGINNSRQVGEKKLELRPGRKETPNI